MYFCFINVDSGKDWENHSSVILIIPEEKMKLSIKLLLHLLVLFMGINTSCQNSTKTSEEWKWLQKFVGTLLKKESSWIRSKSLDPFPKVEKPFQFSCIEEKLNLTGEFRNQILTGHSNRFSWFFGGSHGNSFFVGLGLKDYSVVGDYLINGTVRINGTSKIVTGSGAFRVSSENDNEQTWVYVDFHDYEIDPDGYIDFSNVRVLSRFESLFGNAKPTFEGIDAVPKEYEEVLTTVLMQEFDKQLRTWFPTPNLLKVYFKEVFDVIPVSFINKACS